jgi:hypothetical protein
LSAGGGEEVGLGGAWATGSEEEEKTGRRSAAAAAAAAALAQACKVSRPKRRQAGAEGGRGKARVGCESPTSVPCRSSNCPGAHD